MHIEVEAGLITRVSRSDRARLTIDGSDLQLVPGAVVMSGFVDTHCHLMGLGQMAERVQLSNVNTITDCISRVALRAMMTPPGDWILGFGWNETEWLDHSTPHRTVLDRATPDHPVALYRIDTHAVWINSRALAETGIEPHEIHGGEIVVDGDGVATGLLIDNAVRLIDVALARPTSVSMRRWIGSAVNRCL